jgi:hypothetical protein
MNFTEEDKQHFLTFWKLSGEEGERVWAAKMDMHSNPIRTHEVVPDIQPYRSMADGQMVMGRSQHREMLKRNNCFEVGNEKQTAQPRTPPPGLKETLIRVAQEKLR